MLAQLDYPPRTPGARVVVAGNILLRCFWFVMEFRVVTVVGPLIIAVLNSFAPMIGMFTFMGPQLNSGLVTEESLEKSLHEALKGLNRLLKHLKHP